MGQALYRKYRSKSLGELVGQQHITSTLGNALKADKISHAYLLTGPRGVGKTSVARILAHEVNGLPYVEDTTHLDIIEIDAASNRGIEEIRELREKVHTAPTSAKYKVYIIDEVHMLTKQAFNALLKTLEEPPRHVIFILATTESHKLPETIISRTQRFTFKPVEHSQVVSHLREIADKEGIKIDDEALELIARHGEGSFRDSISLLDQASSSAKSIKRDDILRMLGIPPGAAVSQLLDTILNGTTGELLSLLAQFRDQGFQAGAVAKQAGAALRKRLIEGQLDIPPAEAINLLRQLIAVPASHDPEDILELALLSANLQRGNTQPQQQAAAPAQAAPASKDKNSPAKHALSNAEQLPRKQPEPTAPLKEPQELSPKPASVTIKAVVSEDPPPGSSNNPTLITDVWPHVLTTIKKRHNTLYSILRMAQPNLDKDSLILTFGFAFHQKKINEEKTRMIVSEVVTKLLGQPVSVVCVVEKGAKPPELTVAIEQGPASPKLDDRSLDTISNIFGGGEVLE